MRNELTTSEAGQRLLSRVFQILTNTERAIETNVTPHNEMINQKIAVVRINSQLRLCDINTLGEIFLANARRQQGKLFISNDFSRNVRDLRTLDDILSNPKERKEFIEDEHSQQATNVISFPK